MKGDARPTLQEEVIYRPRQQLQLLDHLSIRDNLPHISPAEPCAPFRNFGLYLMVWGKNAPGTLHIEVEFLERWTGQWYTFKQGLFAALFYEDTDTDPAIYECFCGCVAGRAIRVKVTGTDTTVADFWEFSAAIDLWN